MLNEIDAHTKKKQFYYASKFLSYTNYGKWQPLKKMALMACTFSHVFEFSFSAILRKRLLRKLTSYIWWTVIISPVWEYTKFVSKTLGMAARLLLAFGLIKFWPLRKKFKSKCENNVSKFISGLGHPGHEQKIVRNSI